MLVLQDNFSSFLLHLMIHFYLALLFFKKCDINLTHMQKTTQNVQLNVYHEASIHETTLQCKF